MNILVACEYSGRVREAFARQGHYVLSCDFRATETPGNHYQGNVIDVIHGYAGRRWDMMIAHPICTFNCLSSIQWMYHPEDTPLPAHLRRRHPKYPFRMDDFLKNVEFFLMLKNADIPKIVIENSQPHGLAMQHLGRYTQIVQPWMFGDGVTKGAALWLKGLPTLVPTHTQADYDVIRPDCHYMSPGPNRERERSRTNLAVASAMAQQWGNPFL